MITREIVISGRVHGVGFRWFVKRIANQLGITGFVRNTEDGKVEICAQGKNKEKMEEFTNLCKKGPNFAYVENVTIDDVECEEFSSFEIR